MKIVNKYVGKIACLTIYIVLLLTIPCNIHRGLLLSTCASPAHCVLLNFTESILLLFSLAIILVFLISKTQLTLAVFYQKSAFIVFGSSALFILYAAMMELKFRMPVAAMLFASAVLLALLSELTVTSSIVDTSRNRLLFSIVFPLVIALIMLIFTICITKDATTDINIKIGYKNLLQSPIMYSFPKRYHIYFWENNMLNKISSFFCKTSNSGEPPATIINTKHIIIMLTASLLSTYLATKSILAVYIHNFLFISIIMCLSLLSFSFFLTLFSISINVISATILIALLIFVYSLFMPRITQSPLLLHFSKTLSFVVLSSLYRSICELFYGSLQIQWMAERVSYIPTLMCCVLLTTAVSFWPSKPNTHFMQRPDN